MSQLQVANFPWDPKLETQPPAMSGPAPVNNPPMVPSNGANYQMSAPLPQMSAHSATAPQMNLHGDPRIKTEPGLDSSAMGNMNQSGFQPPPSMSGPQRASERASHLLTQSYGPRADASINAIRTNVHPQTHNPNQPTSQQFQAHLQQQQQQMQQMQQARANGMQPQQRPQMTQEDYQKAMAINTMQQQQRAQAQNGVSGAQTDGAGDDFDGPAIVIKRVNANGQEELGRLEIDNLIRDKIAARGQAMEGGGLMLPLHQATDSKKRQRKVVKTNAGLPQTDGVGSDDDDEVKDGVKAQAEEIDDDAINSDLDDSDDGLEENEEDEDGMGHIMLCMYDKVQRVKNKW